MRRRPKPSRSGKPTWAPIATPCSIASCAVVRMMPGSPAWKPQAMFAEVIHGMAPASSPSRQRPKLSPMSMLMSMLGEPMATQALAATGDGERRCWVACSNA